MNYYKLTKIWFIMHLEKRSICEICDYAYKNRHILHITILLRLYQKCYYRQNQLINDINFTLLQGECNNIFI